MVLMLYVTLKKRLYQKKIHFQRQDLAFQFAILSFLKVPIWKSKYTRKKKAKEMAESYACR